MRYLAGRLTAAAVTLLVVTVVVFAGMRLTPGSYADIVLPPEASPEVRQSLESRYGLDDPLHEQYLSWLGNIATGDFGASLGTAVPVSEVLAQRMPVTLELALLSLVITVLVGVPLAVLAGMAQGRMARGGSRLAGAVAMSTPAFVTGSLFLYLFSRYELGLEVGTYVPFTDDPVGNVRAMLLPAVTIAIFGIALIVRVGRDAVVTVLSDQHVTAALGRGEGIAHVVRHHVLRNATIPVLTVLAIFAGELMGGVVIVETLYTLPGIGQAAVLAINQRDYPVVQSVVLLAAVVYITVNMLADFAYGAIDPRVRRAAKT